MVFPKQLSYLLERDQTLEGAVKLCVSQFEPWINHSHLPFFPEYTDHGLTHIESVLTTATALIRDEAWPVLTSGDAAVLILAILLHDCAMHLSEDGFYALLKEPRSSQIAPGMDADKPWHILWEDFYGEASRFDGRKLKKLFGDLHPARRPPENANDLTKRDRLLIGEFLRRHHPRLAQEIAHYGVPGPADNKDPLVLIGLTKKDMAHVAALAGIVARSHGADVRAFLPYLQKHYDIRQYKNIHPVFLMTLLRVGDYVQIASDRAPAQVLQVKSLASPASQGEWKAHQAIRDIRNTHEDPEALFIDALPEDVETFLRIEDWLKGIQSELDASWAVLGEVYGRYAGLKELGLILRRIRSTIDDPDDFAKKVAYIPKKAAFKAADADLLKLLIEPLYGNSPEIGIRELMQNGLDAVRENHHYLEFVSTDLDLPFANLEDHVSIDVNIGASEAEVTIADCGIGMTPEIVIQYFLVAGASFRRSEDWRSAFENPEGKSKVIRMGRFRIGVFACFLLGTEIRVSTRHRSETSGIEFKASLDGDTIEFRRCQRAVGTTITIPIDVSVAKYLLSNRGTHWDWYCFSDPRVVRRINGQRLQQSSTVPSTTTQLSRDWRMFKTENFSVFWSLASKNKLICNGTKITESIVDHFFANENSDWNVKFPNLSIIDPNGLFPVNLQRNALINRSLPFEDELLDHVLSDLLANLLIQGLPSFEGTPTIGPMIHGGRASLRHQAQPPIDYLSGSGPCWYVFRDGFGHMDPHLIKYCESPVLYTVSCEETLTLIVNKLAHKGLVATEVIPRDIVGHLSPTGFANRPALRRSASRILLPLSRPDVSVRLFHLGWKHSGWVDHTWEIWTSPSVPAPRLDFVAMIQELESKLPADSMIIEWYLDRTDCAKPSLLATKWLGIIGQTEIPLDSDVRRKKLARAYEKLAPYIERYE